MAPHPNISAADIKTLKEFVHKRLMDVVAGTILLGQKMYFAIADESAPGGPVSEMCTDSALLQMFRVVTGPVPIDSLTSFTYFDFVWTYAMT